MSTKSFLLDANAFIEPSRAFYGFDFCPGFWDFLKQEFEVGRIFSLKKVYDELQVGGDRLSEWSKEVVGKAHFVDQGSLPEVASSYEDVSRYVLESTQYNAPAKRTFLQPEEADPWICAYAAVVPCVVVTQEVARPGVKSRVPLPNVLDEFGVQYINIYGCLRQLNARFVLEREASFRDAA